MFDTIANVLERDDSAVFGTGGRSRCLLRDFL